MKTTSTPFFCLIFALLGLSACFSPRPVVRIEPTEEPDKWNYGQAILEAEQDGITASASYAYSDRDFFVFDVEVTNWRTDRILVDPALIKLTVGTANMGVSAVNPETHLLDMEIDASRREANAKNAALAAGIVAVAAVTAAVISETNNNNNNDNNNNIDDTGIDVVNVAPALILGAGGGGQPRQEPLAVDPWFWSDHTLRKTTLEQGQRVRGKVLFPRNDELRNFALSVPIAELTFTFGFKQRLFQP